MNRRTSMPRLIGAALFASLAAFLAMACGDGERQQVGAPPVGGVQQRAIFQSTALRPINASVCFYAYHTGYSDALFDAETAVIEDVMGEWEDASGLRFQFVGRCAPPIIDAGGSESYPEDIRITLLTSDPNLVSNPVEYQSNGNPGTPIPGAGCTLTAANGNYSTFPVSAEDVRNCAANLVMPLRGAAGAQAAFRNILHETGHSLGLAHEHMRSDNNNVDCPWPITVPSCNPDCDPNCMQTQVPTEQEQPEALYGTAYDVNSVMHYNYVPDCNPTAGDFWYACPAPGNFGWDINTRTYTYPFGLSPSDQLATELAYPKSLEPLVCGDRFASASGTFSFQADVVRRGAYIDNTSESMLQNVVWSVDGQDMAVLCAGAGCTATAEKLEFAASLVGNGTHTLKLDYDDAWGRHHSSTQFFKVGGTSGIADPCTCHTGVYEAENMFHSTGGTTTGGWNIWSNGYISTMHDFTAGPNLITVRAAGQAAAGTNPHMIVRVAGAPIGDVYVTGPEWSDYVFTYIAPGGEQEIWVQFDNDYYQPPADRNLLVDKLTIDCAKIQGTPCATFCANPQVFSWTGSYQSGALGTGAICRETVQPVAGGNCGNFTGGRQLLVNGTPMPCNSGNWASLPPSVNGGYCVQTTSGNYPWAYFTLW